MQLPGPVLCSVLNKNVFYRSGNAVPLKFCIELLVVLEKEHRTFEKN